MGGKNTIHARLRGVGGISGKDNELDLVSHVGGNLAIDSVPYGSQVFLLIFKSLSTAFQIEAVGYDVACQPARVAASVSLSLFCSSVH